MWNGLYPPQRIFSGREFRGVALDPPDFEPGSWCGAGKLWVDEGSSRYWLTSRPRVGAERRGYAAEIHLSEDGEDFELSNRVTKEEVTRLAGVEVQSIENQQLLQDPLTGDYHLYLSLDVYRANVAGDSERVYESRWETFLLTADDPAGEWSPEGFVIRADSSYDSGEARDSTIDIVDGRYFALYKARRAGSDRVRMALATSADGKRWRKLGVPGIDGREQPGFFLLNGSILAGSGGPIFAGIQTTDVVKGAALSRRFAAYAIDYRSMNLERIFVHRWKPGSRYEHPDYPIHTYCSIARDQISDRWLTVVEAVDPERSREPGLNLEVDRVLLYTSG